MLQTAHIINIVNVFDKSWSTAQVLFHSKPKDDTIYIKCLDLLAVTLSDPL